MRNGSWNVLPSVKESEEHVFDEEDSLHSQQTKTTLRGTCRKIYSNCWNLDCVKSDIGVYFQFLLSTKSSMANSFQHVRMRNSVVLNYIFCFILLWKNKL